MAPELALAVVERRPLARDCLLTSIHDHTGWSVRGFADAEDWLADAKAGAVDVVLLSFAESPKLETMIAVLKAIAPRAPGVRPIVLCDNDKLDLIMQTIEGGAAGYIPTSLPLDVAIEAIRLVRAGGVYLPASSLFTVRKAGGLPKPTPHALVGIFTARQAAVVDGLCKGKLNKVIAHELKMRESTVKVHVRNIMKKLNARTRTEVAYIVNDLLNAEAADQGSGKEEQRSVA
ncbi:MAG: LuxR C-terminal-related transcriptional regulator [Hyphomicrobiaceae bacterium]